MSADPVLVLAWLALAHLAADFLFQTESVATGKFGHGRQSWIALGQHVGAVGLCLVPVVAVFGRPGFVFLVVVTFAHGAIDRTKVVWTRRVEAGALRRALRDHETDPTDAASSLGAGWTPMPGFLFALDQLAHAAVIGLAWAAWLSSAPFTAQFADAVSRVPATWDPAIVHRVSLTAAVLADLLLVNIRAGLLFVATLVHPRGLRQDREGATGEATAGDVTAGGATTHDASAGDATAYTLRLGPIRLEAAARHRAESAAGRQKLGQPRPVAPPAQVGAAVGVLERLIVVALVLTGASAAIGFVIAAKTLARFKQLDDRDFAEYYLLGTLASVTVALVSGLVAAAALAGG